MEITNTGRRAVNLDSWTLQDEDSHTFTFHHYRLDARSTVRIHTGEDRDSRSDLSQDRRNYVWDNHSDTATLRNDHGRLIDDAPGATTATATTAVATTAAPPRLHTRPAPAHT